MAEQRQPLTLSGTGGEEGNRRRKLVTVTEALHQHPTVLCLQTTPWRGRKEKGRMSEGESERRKREGQAETGGTWRGGEKEEERETQRGE